MTPMVTQRVVKVFIASPGDLAVERRAFKEVIDELNEGFGDGAGVKFEAIGWEDTLATTGRRSQEVINQEVDRADVFILAMHRRWGQEVPDAKPYSSYTEEEFHRAYDRWKKDSPPGQERSPEIFVFFKHIDAASMADAGPQLQKVLDFRKSLEETQQVLYKVFAEGKEAASLNLKTFVELLDRHLRAFAKGDLPKADAPLDKVLLPLAVIEEVKKAKAEAEAANARAERLALDFAEQAAKAALDGRIEEARQAFAKALDGTTNLNVLCLGFEFFNRIGDLDEAERLLRRCLAISGPEVQTADTAAAYGNLGIVLFTRGDLDGAEAMHRKSLEINEKLGRLEGMANQYCNLGIVLKTRGDLDGAEAMFRKSLAISEKLGRPEGMASDYGNLGSVLLTRGDLDLDGAEAMFRKSLAINEKLGRPEGMASDYGNLGIVLAKRGDLDGAEEMHRKSLAIEEKLGRLEGMASDYCNLGIVLAKRGDLDGEEAMYRKSLAIEEKLGRPEGMANQYCNLGIVLKTRGDLAGAREHWRKAKSLYEKIGMPHMVKKVQSLLDDLPPNGGANPE